MKGSQNCQVILQAKILNQVKDFNLTTDIQICCRLVQKICLCLLSQNPGNKQALYLPSGKLTYSSLGKGA
ncbi:unnamed protein product, partial [marine sediment metagenome]